MYRYRKQLQCDGYFVLICTSYRLESLELFLKLEPDLLRVSLVFPDEADD